MLDLTKMDVRKYLDNRGIVYSVSGKNVSTGWIGTTCPFCGDRSNHLGIHLESKVITCWKCGEKGNITKYIMHMDRVPISRAISTIKQYISKFGYINPLDTLTDDYRMKHKIVLNDISSKIIYDPHRKYLENRGFDPDMLTDQFDLRFCNVIGKYKLRIIAPFKLKGRYITYTTRDITGDAEIKYLHCPDEASNIPIKHTLYNVDTVGDTCVVMEGITDVWRMGDGCVALCGKIMSNNQMYMLARFNRVFIMLDVDAKKQAADIANKLSAFTTVEIIDIGKGDPGDLSYTEVRMYRKEIFGRIF